MDNSKWKICECFFLIITQCKVWCMSHYLYYRKFVSAVFKSRNDVINSKLVL